MVKIMRKDDLDFEIEFFERILKENPNFIEALFALGEAYTKKGLYQKGLEIDKRLLELKPEEPTVHYNIACDYSLLKNIELSLFHLEQALKLGWQDLKFIEKDSDLEYVRQDQRYKELIQRYKNKSNSSRDKL